MGEEFGQFKEWDYKEGLEFFLTDYLLHNKLRVLYKDLNLIYRSTEALYSIDYSWDGFEWIDVNNKIDNLICFKRKSKSGKELIALISFNGVDVNNYFLKLPKGKYKVLLNTDSVKYGGNGANKKRVYLSIKNKKYNQEGFVINLPKLTCLYLEKYNQF